MHRITTYVLFVISIELVIATLYLNIPDHAVSFCTYRMNFSHQFGCDSKVNGNDGKILVVRSMDEMQYRLSFGMSEDTIIVMPASLFAKKTLIEDLLKNEKIVGIVVLEPRYCMSPVKRTCKSIVADLPSFSESDPCSNPFFRSFQRKYCEYIDLFGYYNYLYKEWRFPIVLLKSKDNYQNNVFDCFEKYNSLETKGNLCKMIIQSYSHKLKSVANCIEGHYLYERRLWVSRNYNHCTRISGNNIYITFNPSKKYDEKSILLIMSRLDTRSMFDTASAGVQEIYPSISILMYIAQVLRTSTFHSNSEALVAFLDNESDDNLGSIRMIYDLKTNRISNGVGNISSKNIKLILSIDDFTETETDYLFVFLYNCKKSQLEKHCDEFVKMLIKNAFGRQIVLYYNEHETDIWLQAINVPKIVLKSSVLGSAKYRRSFLDRMEPSKLSFLNLFAAIICHAITGIIPNINVSTSHQSTLYPETIVECFYNIDCKFLMKIIGPKEKDYYRKYGNPLVAQSFVDGFIESKHGKYLNRLSYFVAKILITFLKTSSEIDENCQDLSNINNFSITIYDIETCVHSFIQIENNFNPESYASLSDNLTEIFGNFSILPTSMRSFIPIKHKVSMYVSEHSEIYMTYVIAATLLTSLTLVSSVFLYRNINEIIPEEIF